MPFHRSSDAVSTELDDSATVVLHLRTQSYFKLNTTAQLLWNALDTSERVVVSDLVDVLLNHVADEVSRDQAKQDVEAFLSSMQQADLIVHTD